MTETRRCGVLLSLSSLPGPYGIGTLGREARAFVDFLSAASQRCWQLLPLGPTGYGDSPYSALSSYAGNPYFIDPDTLCEQGLLSADELSALRWGAEAGQVDYAAVYEGRRALLRCAYGRGREMLGTALADFTREQRHWLPDYALFMALKERFGMAGWTEWPDEGLRLRREDALAQARADCAEEIGFYTFLQYEFYRQWDALHDYAREKGVALLGDLPFYAALDSADVWSAPEMFQLDEAHRPTGVAGVPPDYFSADGQLWGNPLYDWAAQARDGYGWWLRRLDGAARLYDLLRIDHFRGFDSYWSVPAESETARDGHWEKGPGMDLVGCFPALPIIAEDLGELNESVRQLLRDSGLPGMKILQFAFDPDSLSDYLPHRCVENCVCYAGTHDNATLREWLESAPARSLAFAREYLGLNEDEGLSWGVLRGGMASPAALFIAPMQDYLELGAEARMNTPGTRQGNWRWRMLPGAASTELAERMARMARIYSR